MSKISVLIITYNQEDYIQDCIKSVLNQTFKDFEILVNDDCSTDDTFVKIKEIKDDRIKILKPNYNQGINAALTNLIEQSTGEYLVILGGDDMLENNHLEVTINYLETHPEIDTIYCNITPVDENGNIRYELGKDYMKTADAPEEEFLHKTFMLGNFAFSTGMVIRKEAVKPILPLPYSIVNNQDFKMHIDLMVNNSKNYILPDKLLLYRIVRKPKKYQNISSKSFAAELRESMEFEYVMDSFLKIKDIELLKRIFKEEIKRTGIEPYPETIPYFLGRMALLARKDAKKSWGYHKIINFLDTKENFDIVHERYGFTYKELLDISSNFENSIYHRCYKYKKLFNIFLVGFIISTSLLLILILLEILL